VSANVLANGMEISAKKDGNQSIAGMPDVCLSPPSPPAGPVPIPYPNTAQASDTSDGSKTVKIGGDEVGLKNSSNYKKSTGDEAATKSLGMGVVTHTIQGKMQHAAWSMNVKIEGQNVIRHMDLTTHNHMNSNNSGASQFNQAMEKEAKIRELTCEELSDANESACEEEMEPGRMNESITVTTAQRIYKNGKKKLMKAVSDITAPTDEACRGYEDPRTEKTRMQGCKKGKREKYDAQGKNHTEPKLLEGEWDKGGSIKMSIFHQNVNISFVDDMPKVDITQDAMPCGSCKKAICAAQACGIDITLCNQRNEEVKAKDLCEKGEPKPAGGTSAEKTEFWANAGL